MAANNQTYERLERNLQSASAVAIQSSIQCIQPYDSISFDVSPEHYPVYVKDSKYNSDPNYDFGVFTLLETKLKNAKLAISQFMVNFVYEGVFAFGDSATPQTLQTLVLVTKDESRCFN